MQMFVGGQWCLWSVWADEGYQNPRGLVNEAGAGIEPGDIKY